MPPHTARLDEAPYLDLPARGAEFLVEHAGVMRALAVVLVDGAAWPEAMAQTVPHLAARRFIRAG